MFSPFCDSFINFLTYLISLCYQSSLILVLCHFEFFSTDADAILYLQSFENFFNRSCKHDWGQCVFLTNTSFYLHLLTHTFSSYLCCSFSVMLKYFSCFPCFFKVSNTAWCLIESNPFS